MDHDIRWRTKWNSATSGREELQPLVRLRLTGDLSGWSRLQCGDHDRFDAVGLGRILRRRVAESKPRDHGRPNTTEARLFQQPEHLSLRESTPDSTGPELGIVDY